MEQTTDGRAALVIIDLQNGFFEDPVLARERPRIVEATNTLAERAREAGAPVFTVVTEHARDRCTWTLNMRDDDQGFNFEGTTQASLLSDLHLPGPTASSSCGTARSWAPIWRSASVWPGSGGCC